MKAAFLLVLLLLIASIPAYAGPDCDAVCALWADEGLDNSESWMCQPKADSQSEAQREHVCSMVLPGLLESHRYRAQKAQDEQNASAVLQLLGLALQIRQAREAAALAPAPDYIPTLPPPGNPPIGSPWCRSLTIQGTGPTASLMCLH